MLKIPGPTPPSIEEFLAGRIIESKLARPGRYLNSRRPGRPEDTSLHSLKTKSYSRYETAHLIIFQFLSFISRMTNINHLQMRLCTVYYVQYILSGHYRKTASMSTKVEMFQNSPWENIFGRKRNWRRSLRQTSSDSFEVRKNYQIEC